MRRYLKKALKNALKELIVDQNNLIDTIDEDYATVQRTNEVDAYVDYIEQRLFEYQNIGIEIGNRIDAADGENTKAVRLLEQYCDAIYQANLSVKSADIRSAVSNVRQMNSFLENVMDEIESGLPNDKLEVVFLPYKASMWDSFESVWMAAKEDENCNVQVIPIPYFDKNPDGSVKQVHYEGDQYPADVPVVEWNRVDLEQLHPDVVYIHNPYDNYNYVTSVHPDYYSSKLKKCTEMLVYIPYFVSNDDVDEHFCKSIGVYNSNKVIVQSEKIKETYKKYYIEAMGEKQKANEKAGAPEDKLFWESLNRLAEEKFLALGSPKFDKVSGSKLTPESLPDDWKKIYNADGTKKKVVFYNTTIQAFLDSKEDYLKKVENVLLSFEKNTDILLLWRPHPLLKATIESMVKELAGKYQKLIDDFKQKDFGIFDESADMSRAIEVSDAYYGDLSSVVALYKATGKPILIQSYAFLEEVTR